MSLNWIRRGVRCHDTDSSRLTNIRVDDDDKSTLKKLKKARSKSAEELRGMFKISISQIEADGLETFRGADKIMEVKPLLSFAELEETVPEIGSYLRKFEKPTPVQRAVIPLGLQKISLAAVAPTGSGKTLAFLIPILCLMREDETLSALILSPTRELANQTKEVATDLFSLAAKCVQILGHEIVARLKAPVGEETTDSSKSSLLTFEKRTLVCCTPGVYHIFKKSSKADIVVLDEVDALLDSGLLDSCQFLTSKKTRPSLLMMFTASLKRSGRNIERLSEMLPKNSPIIQIGDSSMSASDHIDFRLLDCGTEAGKITAFKQLLQDHELIPPCLIFVQDKDRAELLVKFLEENIFRKELYKKNVVGGLHGNMSSADRSKSYQDFLSGETWFLVSTDIASRGLDFGSKVRLVVNYDLPTNRESLIHRMGRTGRADWKGSAITLYTKSDMDFMRVITSVMKESNVPIPRELENLPRVDIKDFIKHPPIRAPIGHMDKSQNAQQILKKHALLTRKEARNDKKTANKLRFKIKNFKKKRQLAKINIKEKS